ncbi:MAG TPA: outer membrane protein assembly factor BamC [Burkholderiales bacterium]|nr:outer membrane protein assembly factor BamC [Burkholderiales bacterium]
MHQFLVSTVAAAAVLSLSGCSWFSSDSSSVDYKSAGTLPPLEVPPDLTSPQRDNRYAIPETARSSATLSGYEAERRDPARGGRPVAATPGAPVVLPVVESIRIERAGTQRWLVVQEPPEKLWPVVKVFWQENGFLIKVEVPEAGVMETDWAESRARIQQGAVRDLLGKVFDYFHSTAERDKYRTRLDRTADGSTEIYISHRGMQELYTTRDPRGETPGATAWQPRPSDPELEAEFLRRLMVRLGTPVERATQLAASSEQQLRAELVKANDGTERLQVYEPFDRAWRRVGLALDRVGFTVEDRDRQKGLYFVRYADPENEANPKDSGFISRLFTFGSDPKVKAEQYRVQVSAETSGSQVYVLNKDGTAENSKTAQRILALLHEQLK